MGKRRALRICGLAALWPSVFMLNPFSYIDLAAGTEDALRITYLCLLLALLAAPALSARVRACRPLDSGAVLLGAGLGGGAGKALLSYPVGPAPVQLALSVGGIALHALFTAMLLVFWMRACARHHHHACTDYLLSAVLFGVIAALSFRVASGCAVIVFTALPAVSGTCAWALARNAGPAQTANAELTAGTPGTPRAAYVGLAAFLVPCFVVTVYFNGMADLSMAPSGVAYGYLAGAVVNACMLPLAGRLARGERHALTALFCTVAGSIVVGFLLSWFITLHQLNSGTVPLTTAMKLAESLWLLLAVHDAGHRGSDPARATCAFTALAIVLPRIAECAVEMAGSLYATRPDDVVLLGLTSVGTFTVVLITLVTIMRVYATLPAEVVEVPVMVQATPEQLAQREEELLARAQATWRLSERELEVVRLARAGNSAKAIARQLCLSTNTVNSHVKHAYRKMDVHSREEMNGVIEQLG